MKITFSTSPKSGKNLSKHALVVALSESLKLSPEAAQVDKSTGGAIAKALKASKFKGKAGEAVSIVAPSGIAADRLVLLGLGDEKKLKTQGLRDAGGSLAAHLDGAGVEAADVLVDTAKINGTTSAHIASAMAGGAKLRHYTFNKYRTKMKPEQKPTLAALTFVLKDVKKAEAAYAPEAAVAESVCFARDLMNEPANIIHPESLAAECKKLSKLGLKVDVLGEAEMRKLGMGALLGVGQGSVRDSQLVVMQWNGGKKGSKPLAFVGKGVTFDTGGISLKPAGGMDEMKFDMGGSAAVIGLMKALATRKAKANVVGVVGLVENMPDGNAQRPGDIVTTMSGQTVEILNTDAEGRLVLADALWYTQDRFKPELMVNLATLTGAIVVSLGVHRAGLFSNNDKLSERLTAAGDKTGEKIWRLPIGDEWDKDIDSDIADMKNIGKDREAGSITAAQFLQRFVNKTPWAHLDIAGTAWIKKDLPTVPKGGTAFGIQLLNQFIADYYE